MQKKNKQKEKKIPMANENLTQQLKSALEIAKQEIVDLNMELAFLKTSPLEYSTVVKVGNIKKMPAPDKKSDFKNGTKVRIKDEALESYNVGYPAGKIQEIKGDNVLVRMLDGNSVNVALGHLKLQDPSMEDVKTVTVATPNGLKEVLDKEELKLKVGDAILVRSTGAIVDKAPHRTFGTTAVVKEIRKDGLCDVTEGDKTRPVYTGGFKLEKGDIVILDQTGHIIVENRKADQSEFNVDGNTIDVSWNLIGGLQDTKETVREMVELPRLNPEMFKGYGKKASKGLLLYGPPGCGKTLVAKAVATSIAKLHGASLKESGFIYVKGPEILNPYVGVAEQVIRSIFERARRHEKKAGYPATIFIDEADAVLAKRGSGISSDVNKTIVPMFLTEMDGLENSGAFIVLATNRADILDEAVVREGRIDRKLKIDRPDEDAVRQILTINLKGIPCQEKHDIIFDVVCNEIFFSSLRETVSGASIANLVDQAIGCAIRRDLKKGLKKPSGVIVDDFLEALDNAKREQLKGEDVEDLKAEEIELE